MKKSIALIMALLIVFSSALLCGCGTDGNNGGGTDSPDVNASDSYEDAVAQMADIFAGKGTPAMLKATMPDEFWNKCVEDFDGDLDDLLEGFIDIVSDGRLAVGKKEVTVKDYKFYIIDPQQTSSSELEQMRQKMSSSHQVDYAEFTDGYSFAVVEEMTVEDNNGNVITTDTRGESEEEAKFGAVKVNGNWHMIMINSVEYNGETFTSYKWILEDLVNDYVLFSGEEYIEEAKAEVAKSNGCAVMESLNGSIIIGGIVPLEITEDTTIQQVIDALNDAGVYITIDHLDTSKCFLDYCEWKDDSVGYVMKSLDNADWLELYAE